MDTSHTEIPKLLSLSTENIPEYFHIFFGLYLLFVGILGSLLSLRLGVQVLKYSKLESSDLLLLNFIGTNLFLLLFQNPFSAYSSFHSKWMFGDFGCVVYAFVGFILGMSNIYGCFLISIGLSLMTQSSSFQKKTTSEKRRATFSWISGSWLLSFLVAVGPATGTFGNYALEPIGTACTLDFLHPDASNYIYYTLFLVIFAFGLPALYTVYCLLTLGSHANTLPGGEELKKIGLLTLIITLLCWFPYVLICLWTIFFEYNDDYILLTYIPPATAKMSVILHGFTLMKNKVPYLSKTESSKK